MKTTRRRVLEKANDGCWLKPWVGFIFDIKEYADGRKVMYGPGIDHTINGYMKYFSKPLKP